MRSSLHLNDLTGGNQRPRDPTRPDPSVSGYRLARQPFGLSTGVLYGAYGVYFCFVSVCVVFFLQNPIFLGGGWQSVVFEVNDAASEKKNERTNVSACRSGCQTREPPPAGGCGGRHTSKRWPLTDRTLKQTMKYDPAKRRIAFQITS